MAKTKRTLFVAMPFRDHHRPVLDVIKKAAETLNLEVVQLAEEAYVGSIVSYIRQSIEEADLVLAIVSEQNGNVYYEIGLAHCQQKPVVLLTSNPDALAFDLRDHRAIVYDPKNPEKIIDALIKTLHSAIEVHTDPRQFIAAVMGGSSHDPNEGLRKAMATIVAVARLQEPIKLNQMYLQPDGSVAIEVEDFLAVRYRAVFDVNGILKTLKQIN